MHLFERWQACCFEAMMLWELVLRAGFVQIPMWLCDHFQSINKIVSFFFVYVMLQALALLWAFLGIVATVLGENMIGILLMPFHQALCVVLLHISVIGMIIVFGRATWILTWQSTDNFPLIRRMIAYECRPQSVIWTIAVPMVIILLSLLLVPSICVEENQAHLSYQTICEDSYLKFISNQHPVFQRSLRLSTSIAICQFIQTCLEILPPWRAALRGLSSTSTLVLGSCLCVLTSAGIMWLIEWMARHFAYQVTPLSHLSSVEWEVLGMTLFLLWIVWYLTLTAHTLPNVQSYGASQRQLVGLFERLKYTFVFGQGLVFVRACLHPSMGFVHAQLELTIINLLLPSIYVFSLITLRLVTLSNWKSVAFSLPLALVVGTMIFQGSKMTHKPHAFIVMCIFLFVMGLRLAESILSPVVQRTQSASITTSLWQLLHTSTAVTKPLVSSHRFAKQIVYIGVSVSIVLILLMAGFSLLSVLQRQAKWFPDATSVHFDQSSISVHHTAAVKMHLGLANATHPPIDKSVPEYASCRTTWNNLTLLDYGLLAQAAYFDPTSDDIPRFVSQLFENAIVRFPLLNSKTGSKSDFYEVVFPDQNLSVIAVRGTDIWRFTDFVEDIKMFIEPVNFAILSTLFPTIRIWPDITFSTLIELFHQVIALLGLQHDSWYYHELLEYVASIQDRDVVFTGHSLGGGIARIVAAINGRISVTFSPPGFVQGFSKLVHDIGGQTVKVDRQKLHHRNVAVIPEYDPITMVDGQAGMLQKISCSTSHLSMQLSCHMLEGTICNLLEHCGDAQARFASCAFEHQIASITQDLMPLLATMGSYESMVPITVLMAVLVSIAIGGRRRTSAPSPTPSPSPSPTATSSSKPSTGHSRMVLRRRSSKETKANGLTSLRRRQSAA